MKTFYTFLIILLIANLAISQENGGPYTPDANTVLLMHFDGNATNSASVGNNGIVHGTGVSYETSIHGQCLRLNNSTADKQSWIEVPFYDELNFTEEFSIECWFKLNSWGENHTKFPIILKKGENWQADYQIQLIQEKNVLAAEMNCINDDYNRGGYVGTTDIIESGKWYHIAVYFNFSHNHLYLVLRDENYKEIYANHKYTYTKPFNSNDKLYIGFANNNETYFDGWIDELRISNKYLKHRDDIVSNINIAELKDSVQPLLRDKWKVYQWPFMAYFPVSKNTGVLHKGNSCGMTASMRLIHYWEHPRFPIGNIDYDDGEFHWLADFDHSEYRFDEMPYVFDANPTEEEYSAAATMVAHIGAAEKKYGVGGGGAPIKTILEKYFRFNKDLKIVYREEYTKTEWENIFKNELSNGRPILIEGTAERYDDGSWAGHFYICDGYSADNKFHTDLSIDNTEWWTDIDHFEYGKNQSALIYAEPDWQGKTLSLDYPKGDEYFQKQTDTEIKWSSENINTVLLEYSTDAGKNWQPIAENVNAGDGKFLWVTPETVSKEYKVRVSDSADGNIYRRSQTFNVFNQQVISFEYPVNNTYFQTGTTQTIYWESEGIKDFKLEYSTNGEQWQTLLDSVTSSTNKCDIILPETESEKLQLKATSLTSNQIYFISEPLRCKNAGLIGGVYKKKDQDILLMHFEENTENAVQNNVQPKEKSTEYKIFDDNFDLHLGKSFRINNTAESNWHCLRTPHTDELNLGNNWTIETWVKFNEIGTPKTQYPLILEKAESFGIWLSGDGNGFGGYAKFNNLSDAGFFQNQQLQPNKWYHVAMTSNGSTKKVKFYVHDEHRQLIFEDSRDFPTGHSGELNHSNNDLFIGGVDGGSNIQFDGWMDEFRISKEPVDYSAMVTKVFSPEIPTRFLCYPNPITSESVISFQTKTNDKVNLAVYDIQGRKICTLLNEIRNSGYHTVPVENIFTAGGVYLCKLTTSEGVSTLKLIVNKQ